MKFESLIAATALMAVASTASANTFVRMETAGSGGAWYPLGARIMQIFENEIDGISTANTAGGGGVANVITIDQGDAEIGFSYAHSSYNGYTGGDGFSREHTRIRHFATLFPAILQVAVPANSSIQDLSEIGAADISPGMPNWAGTELVQTVLGTYDMSFDSIRAAGGAVHHGSYADTVALVKDGHVDVFFAATSLPQASFIELEQSPGLRFLEIPEDVQRRVTEINPGYVATIIPAGTYEATPEDVRSVAMVTNLIVSADLSDDLVYQMCRVFWDNHAAFVEVNAVMADVLVENALQGAGIPVHPGAARCYEELGVTQ